jgi:hydrocephalus-inducing protein
MMNPADDKFGARSYTISPSSGIVGPGETCEFTVKFTPEEAYNFDAVLTGIFPTLPEKKIRLFSKVRRPLCHFKLEETDYRNRRPVAEPLDPKYSILEFESLGTQIKNTKRFYVRNPTAESYEFNWTEDAKEGMEAFKDGQNPFRCVTPRGTILPGKMFLMVFEYLPMEVPKTVDECFWTFKILGSHGEEKDRTKHFLIAGSVKEPRVGMNVPSHNFGKLLLGGRATATVQLVNKEITPFAFEFDPSSFTSEREPPALKIHPMRGTVGPETSMDIDLIFEPKVEQTYNFNVNCLVKRKEKKVTLNVKGWGYKVHADLVLEQHGDRRPFYPGVKERIDFGEVQVNETASVVLRLKNGGQFNFDYTTKIKTARGILDGALLPTSSAPYLSISHPRGTVEAATGSEAKDEVEIKIDFTPRESFVLDGTMLRLLIPTGPGEASFTAVFEGRARKPAVDFSFRKHDFGACFLKPYGAEDADEQLGEEKVILTIHNRDSMDVLLSSDFEKLPHLDMKLDTPMIPMGSSVEVPVIFTPRELKAYHDIIEFKINDYDVVRVMVSGKGVALRLELVKESMKTVDFGTLTGGDYTVRSIVVANRGPKTCQFKLEPAEIRPDVQRYFDWEPQGVIMLRPREQKEVTMTFAPKSQIDQFRFPFVAKTAAGPVHLTYVKGCCHSSQFKLEVPSVEFKKVVVGSRACRRVHLHNFGDLGSAFKLQMPTMCRRSEGDGEGGRREREVPLGRMVHIEPEREGPWYVNPMDDVVLMVYFQPKEEDLGKGGRDVTITVDNILFSFDTEPKPQKLTVTGIAAQQPEDTIGEIEFLNGVVRQAETTTKQLPITFTEEETLHPVIRMTKIKGRSELAQDRRYGDKYFQVFGQDKDGREQEGIVWAKAGTQPSFSVKYLPLSSADADACHEGEIFFTTKDGQAQKYKLKGTASKPDKAITLEPVTVEAKNKHVQGIPVENWLHVRQSFDVQVVEPEEGSPEFNELNIQYAKKFDLPASLTRDYKFSVYAHTAPKDAVVKLKFTNKETGEYTFYEQAFKVQGTKTINAEYPIKFETSCRQEVSYTLRPIKNDLNEEVRFSCSSEGIPGISFRVGGADRNEFVIPPKQERVVDVVFKPVLEAVGEGEVKLSSAQLGDFKYKVTYKVGKPGMEKMLVLKASIGSDAEAVATPGGTAGHPGGPDTYTAEIKPCKGHSASESACFQLEDAKPQDVKQSGDKVNFTVKFTPSSLKETRAMLEVKSKEGMLYQWMLTGLVKPPGAKGPIECKAGTNMVEFRNPFPNKTKFFFKVDNPAYQLESEPFKELEPYAESKKDFPIPVKYTKPDDGKNVKGRLLVSCSGVPKPWVFFLEGQG